MGGLKGRRGRRGEHGYILLDVLIAMGIALVGLGVLFGGLGVAARLAVVQGERVRLVVEGRNAEEKDRAIYFTAR